MYGDCTGLASYRMQMLLSLIDACCSAPPKPPGHSFTSQLTTLSNFVPLRIGTPRYYQITHCCILIFILFIMRLIRIHSDGRLSLVQSIDNKPIRPYGILSHTWLLAEDEVTFKDMEQGHGMEKKGFAKIKFCAERAKRDGLEYFWVDTCCIDKSQGPELNEAITSMYRWYQEAAKCYVYLRDVRCGTASHSIVEKAIRRSRWFKRGWTLQELLAPQVVEFYNEEGDFLGDRSSLSNLIYSITKIPQPALAGKNLSEFEIETRHSWMEGRGTTKPEDKAYALLGIFGVVMVPIYGEGIQHARARLDRKIQRSVKLLEENRLRLLQSQSCKKSRDLGFPGCGAFSESVRIDDGLTAPYFIPLQWCETPKVSSMYPPGCYHLTQVSRTFMTSSSTLR